MILYGCPKKGMLRNQRFPDTFIRYEDKRRPLLAEERQNLWVNYIARFLLVHITAKESAGISIAKYPSQQGLLIALYDLNLYYTLDCYLPATATGCAFKAQAMIEASRWIERKVYFGIRRASAATKGTYKG